MHWKDDLLLYRKTSKTKDKNHFNWPGLHDRKTTTWWPIVNKKRYHHLLSGIKTRRATKLFPWIWSLAFSWDSWFHLKKKKCKSGPEKQRWPNWCWTGRWIKWQFPFSPENGNCPDNRFFNQHFLLNHQLRSFFCKKYASSFYCMYESREMAFLPALA